MTAVGVSSAPRRLPRVRRGWIVAATLLVWLVGWLALRGRATLVLATADLSPLHERLNGARDYINLHRGENLFFTGVVDVIRTGVDQLATFVRALISVPAPGRPTPPIGWLGVVALVALAAYALGNLRVALLAAAGFTSLGLLGLWTQSMDTLALTLTAVSICLVIGVPLGIAVGLSRPLERALTPVLDLMQAMPTFVYLAPLALFFLIGPATGVIATVIYAIAPVIRLTAHGVAGVPEAALESSRSVGATRWQLLRKVRLPMAKHTIMLGVNQTTMCALSMVTIAALVDAPGLGQTVLGALRILDVGTAFNGGLAIVIMAIVLDRVTTAASERTRAPERAGFLAHRRRLTLAGLGVSTVVAIYLAYTYYWAAQFPGPARGGGVAGLGLADAVSAASDWVSLHLYDVTQAVKNLVTYGLLNPFQALLAESPWYLICAVVLTLSWALAGARAVATAAICLATALTIALGVAAGVWMGRSNRADALIRPTLDAAQVMPAFVYLVPFFALFGPTRFTAIVAAVVFAAPVAIKIVADGIRAVPATVVEAATAAGSSPWQLITKVQLPLARRALVLAANQGLIYVLSMVVVGGLVGAGALGYLVVAGFSQGDLYGKGLAAGAAIVLLGILLDRVTQAAARAQARQYPNG